MNSIVRTVIGILLFLVFEYISLSMYFKSDESTYAKNINAISYINLGLSDISSYFGLHGTIDELTENITLLEAELRKREEIIELYRAESVILPDSIVGYNFAVTGAVIYQNLVMSDNLIKINKGAVDGVEENMTIVKNGSLIGYVLEVREEYCVVRSILSKKIKTSGALKKNDSYCSIWWNGENIHTLDFAEMSKYSDVKIGDTVTTTPFSNRFAKNLNIGVVSELELIQGMYFNGKIKLLSDFKQLNFLTIIATPKIDTLTVIESNIEDYE